MNRLLSKADGNGLRPLPAEGVGVMHPLTAHTHNLLEQLAGHAVAAVGGGDVSGDLPDLGGGVGRTNRQAHHPQAGDIGDIVTADTLVIVEGEILGKPSNAETARRMLRRLSGMSTVESTMI